MNTEKIKEVFSDEIFVGSLFSMDTAAEVQAALKEKGIEMTEDEILSVRDLLCKVESGEIDSEQLQNWSSQTETGELSEEELEAVAGGVVLSAFGLILFAAAVIVGAVSGVAIYSKITGTRW
ncbi:MAG: Nif11-like leader peptide family natural product precursor [Clostridia bacterium]|nr:Nif11-like leader peptide family natural product precursor [Clostridia bacterium]